MDVQGGVTFSPQSCSKPAFRTSHLCKDHLVTFQQPAPPEDLALTDQIKTALAPDYRHNMASTANHKNNGLLCSLRSVLEPHQCQILSFLISNSIPHQGRCGRLESVMPKAKSSCIAGPSSYSPVALEDVATRTDQLNFRMQRILKGATSKHSCRDLRMTARQVANRLWTLGITPQTTFVAWHNYAVLDLSALRDWLELEGEANTGSCLMIPTAFLFSMTFDRTLRR